jgi:hypothetical protein
MINKMKAEKSSLCIQCSVTKVFAFTNGARVADGRGLGGRKGGIL